MNRVNIINELIRKHNYKSYLEIGIRGGECFNSIQCEYKIGVDPDTGSAATIFVTSDEFFKNSTMMFNIIFLDGLHHSDQVDRDIRNALNHLTDNGTIIMHDCLPLTKRMQEIPLQEQNEWCGDVWKSFVKAYMEMPHVNFHTIDTDYGCGILQFTKRSDRQIPACLPSPDQELTYEEFLRNRDCWMNTISVAEFKQKFLD